MNLKEYSTMNLRQAVVNWDGYLMGTQCEALQLVIDQYRKRKTERTITALLEERTDLCNGLKDIEQFEYPDANRDAWTEYAIDRVKEIYTELLDLGHYPWPLQSEIRLLKSREEKEGWYFGSQTWNGYDWDDNLQPLSIMYYKKALAIAATPDMVHVYRCTDALDEAVVSAYYISMKYHPGNHEHAVMRARWAMDVFGGV